MPPEKDDPYFTPDPSPSRRSSESAADKIRRIARSDNLPDDLADDFSKVTGLESGRSHFGRRGQVKLSPVDPKDGQRAIGFSQIKPATAKSVGVDNPYDEESNIKAGLRYYAQGGDDPVRRRIAYFSGQNSGAVKHYDRTGKIPSGGDFTGTSFKQYIAGTGGNQSRQDRYLTPEPQKPDPYFTPDKEPPIKSLRGTTVMKPMRSKSWGRGTIGEGVTQPIRPSLPDLKQADEKVVAEMYAPQQRSTLPPTNVDLRVLKGEQPENPLEYARAQELATRIEPKRTETHLSPMPASMQARTPSLMERLSETVNEAVKEYAPGIANLDTPAGIKTDLPRGILSAATLGAVEPREISREEKLINSQAESDAALARGVGEVGGALIPFTVAGKIVESLNAPRAIKTAVQFGLVDAGHQVVNELKGRNVDWTSPVIQAGLGAVIGKLEGANPGMVRRAIAFVAPQLALDAAKGTPKEQATLNALTNLGFALSAGGRQREGVNEQPTNELDARSRRAVTAYPDNGNAALPRSDITQKSPQGRINEPTQTTTTQGGANNPQAAQLEPERAANTGENVSGVSLPEGQQRVVAGANPLESRQAVEPLPRHVDLQKRITRGPNAGDFAKETRAETKTRQAQVNPASEPNQLAKPATTELPSVSPQREATPSVASPSEGGVEQHIRKVFDEPAKLQKDTRIVAYDLTLPDQPPQRATLAIRDGVADVSVGPPRGEFMVGLDETNYSYVEGKDRITQVPRAKLGTDTVLAVKRFLQAEHPEVRQFKFVRAGSTGGEYGRKRTLTTKPQEPLPNRRLADRRVVKGEPPDVNAEQRATVEQGRARQVKPTPILDREFGRGRTGEVYSVRTFISRIPVNDLKKIAELDVSEFSHLSTESAHQRAFDKLWKSLSQDARDRLLELNATTEGTKQEAVSSLDIRKAAIEQLASKETTGTEVDQELTQLAPSRPERRQSERRVTPPKVEGGVSVPQIKPRSATEATRSLANVLHQNEVEALPSKQRGNRSAFFRIQDERSPLPERSRSNWTGDENSHLSGVSAFSQLLDASRDILLDHDVDGLGMTYSEQIRDAGGEPTLSVFAGRDLGDESPNVRGWSVEPERNTEKRFTPEEITQAWRNAVIKEFPEDKTEIEKMDFRELYDNYELSDNEVDAYKALRDSIRLSEPSPSSRAASKPAKNTTAGRFVSTIGPAPQEAPKGETSPKSVTVEADPYFTPDQKAEVRPALPEKPKASAPEPGRVTAVKDASMQAKREQLGLPELERVERVAAPEVLAKAEKANTDDPHHADSLVEQALKGGKNWNNVETMQVNLRSVDLENRIEKLNNEIYKETDPKIIAEKAAESDALIAQFGKLSEASDLAGAEWSRAGTARRIALKNDFTIARVVTRMKKALGRDLTTPEREKFDKMVAERDQAIADRDKAIEEARTAKLQREIGKVQRQRVRAQTKQALDTEAATIKSNIAAEFARLKSQSAAGQFKSQGGLGALDPDGVITKELIRYARNRVKANVEIKAEQLIDDVHSIVKDFTDKVSRREIAELVSGYKMAVPEKRPEDVRRLAEIRSEIKRLLAAQDVVAGKITARQQGPKPDYVRRNRELRIVRDRIDELQSVLKSGVRTERGKMEHVPDAELEGLRAERDSLSNAVKALADPNADQKAIDFALKAVTRTVESLEGKLKSGNVAPERKTVSPWSEELGLQQQRRAELQKQLDAARKAERPDSRAQQKIDSALKATNKSIDDLQKRIALGQIKPTLREGAQAAYSPEISAAKKVQAELQKTLNDMRTAERKAAPPLPPKQGPPRWLFSRNATRLKQLQKQEVELSRRLEERDFSKPVKSEPIPYTREVAARQRQIDELEQRFKREEYRANRSTGGRIADELAKGAGVLKTIKSMGDISAVFRQGGFYALSHPIKGLAVPFKDMVKSFSDAGYRNVEQAIKSHPKFEQAKRDGVEFTGVDKNDPNLSKHEEGYLGREWLDYVPVAKQVGRFSERTFVSFLDSQRMSLYDALTDGLANPSRLSRLMGAREGLSPSELALDRKRIGKAINSATGRGNLGKAGNQAAPVLNIAMFSPRLLKSRVELLSNMFNPVAWKNMPRNSRAQILQDNVKFLAGTIAVMGIAKAAGGEVNTDPDDGDFLKIRFGNTTYDTLTGLQQPLRYAINMSRALSPVDSKTFQAGPTMFTGKDAWEQTAGDKVHGGFLESKASPLVSGIIETVRGTDFSGRKRSIRERAKDVIMPLPAKDIIEAFQKDGLLGAVKATPTFTGIGVNTYPVPPEKPVTRAEKLTRKIIRDKMPSEGRTDEEIDRDQKLGELRAQARKGIDVSKSLDALKAQGVIDERKEKSILGARGVTRLQEGFKRLPLYDPKEHKDALTVYSTMTPSEQESVKKIMGEKAVTVDLLPSDDQKDARAKLQSYGFKPGLQIPKRPTVNRPERPNPRAWSYQ